MGRRKIEIVKVKDPNTRQVTFSKRRTGLFKKANELSILCGAEVAIVVFSPGNKPYSFGHPGVDTVAAKYLLQQNGPNPNEAQNAAIMDMDMDMDMDKYNQILNDVTAQLREDEKKGAEHAEAINKLMGTQLSELQKSHVLLAEQKVRVNDCLGAYEAAEVLLLLKLKPRVGIKNHVAKKKNKNRSGASGKKFI